MNIAVMIQARLNSTRLPKKVLKKIKDKTILQHCIDAAKQISADSYWLLVPKSERQIFYPIAYQNYMNFYEGSEDNVLERFYKAIEISKCDVVVRVTGDKVITAVDYVNEALKYIEDSDLVSYEEDPLLSTTHCIIKANILTRAFKEVTDKQCLEHVKPCVKCLNGSHKILEVPDELKKFKYNFTIDTEEDFNRSTKMFNDIYKKEPVKFSDALNWMSSNNKK